MTTRHTTAHDAAEVVPLQELLDWATLQLSTAGIADAAVDAQVLTGFVLSLGRGELEAKLITGLHVDADDARTIRELVDRRAAREPLQHILGVAWFRSLTLEVGPGVFVPRPETEQLAGMAIDTLRSLVEPSPIAVDLGTGSGAIALAMATEVPHARIYAVEKSADALPWTSRNFAQLGAQNATLIHGDLAGPELLDAHPELAGKVAVIASNPPYIPLGAIPRDPEVQLHDPHLALYGGEDGLDVVRQVSQVGLVLGRPGAQLLLEHGELQGQSIRDILDADGWRATATHRDLTGRDRYTTATRPYADSVRIAGVTVAISPKVSVALCTYNGALYLAEQLRSIAEQTVLPTEIVIVDDRSSDDTVATADAVMAELKTQNFEFAQVEVRVEVNEASLGVTKNFERAISLTTREYIFLSDQDDVWTPDRIKVQLAELEAGAGFVFGDADLIDESGASLGHSLFDALDLLPREREGIIGAQPVDVLIRRNIVTGATAAFSRRVFEAASPFPSSWVHDEWLAMVAALNHEQFALTPTVIGYRQHGKNQIGVKRKTAASRVAKLTADGRARNARLLQRAQDLASRFSGTSSNTIDAHSALLIDEALKHQTSRSAFRSNRLVRLPQVLREVLSGRYFRVSNGPRDVLRDVVQPL